MMTGARGAGSLESTVGSLAQRRLRVNENKKQLTVVRKERQNSNVESNNFCGRTLVYYIFRFNQDFKVHIF